MGNVRNAALAAAFALALPATALAEPSSHRVDVTLQRGQSVRLTIGKVPTGEFAFKLTAANDAEKKVKVTQKRVGGKAFTVVDTANGVTSDACGFAAGTVICDGITTPATPGNRSWVFTVTSTSSRPTIISLAVTWRPVGSAG
jgi:hypothetical protein